MALSICQTTSSLKCCCFWMILFPSPRYSAKISNTIIIGLFLFFPLQRLMFDVVQATANVECWVLTRCICLSSGHPSIPCVPERIENPLSHTSNTGHSHRKVTDFWHRHKYSVACQWLLRWDFALWVTGQSKQVNSAIWSLTLRQKQTEVRGWEITLLG